jgi:hypothetical protein
LQVHVSPARSRRVQVGPGGNPRHRNLRPLHSSQRALPELSLEQIEAIRDSPLSMDALVRRKVQSAFPPGYDPGVSRAQRAREARSVERLVTCRNGYATAGRTSATTSAAFRHFWPLVLRVDAELAQLDDRRSAPPSRVGRERQRERHPVRFA